MIAKRGEANGPSANPGWARSPSGPPATETSKNGRLEAALPLGMLLVRPLAQRIETFNTSPCALKFILCRFHGSMSRDLWQIRAAFTLQDLAEIRLLFEEYAASLKISLCFQGFGVELAGLPGAYGGPRGRLLLARAKAGAAGCVAFRPADEGICEMKRLFVRPADRGAGLGRALAERAIVEARGCGYKSMRLDTLPIMESAIRLYRALGFVERSPYYDTPVAETVFMELRL